MKDISMSNTNELHDKIFTKNSEASFNQTQFQLLEPLWWRELINNKMKCNLFVLVDPLNIKL